MAADKNVISILLVEDDHDNAMIVEGLLVQPGERYLIEIVENLGAALTKLSTGSYNLIILDLNLPDSKGLATFRRVFAERPNIPIVILTSNDDIQSAKLALQEGAQDYLLKQEVSQRVIIRAINFAKERKRAEQAIREARDSLEIIVDQRTAELREALAESVKKERRLSRQNRELATLHTLTAAVNSRLDLDHIINVLAQLLHEQLNIPGGNLYLISDDRNDLVSMVSWGIPDGVLNDQQKVEIDPERWNLIDGGKPTLWQDCREVPHLRRLKLNVIRPEWQSYLCIPLTASNENLGLLELFSAKPDSFTESQMTFFHGLGQQTGVAINNANLYKSEQRARETAEQLSIRLLNVQEIERRKLARELHDEVGQTLTGLKITLEMAGRQAEGQVREKIDTAVQMVLELSGQMREISHSLRPSSLDDLGLLSTLLTHCNRFTDRTGINVDFTHSGLEGRRFSSEVETTIYRIVQESLTNMARYAEVASASVHVLVQDVRVTVQISDQGRGFDPLSMDGEKTSGLRGMRERVAMLGGHLRIDSSSGTGTSITATLPLDSQGPKSAQLQLGDKAPGRPVPRRGSRDTR